MISARISVGLAVLLAVAGCTAVYNAQQVRQELAAKAHGMEAERPEPLRLADFSLEELVGFAMTNHPSMISSALAVKDAHLALREIAAGAPLIGAMPWMSPKLKLSAGHSESSVSDSTLHSSTYGNASAGLSLQILLYDFGRNRAEAHAQAERVIAAEHSFIESAYKVFENVSAAYFGLHEQTALLEVAVTNAQECAELLRQSEEMLAAGESRQLDVLRARSNLSQAKESVIAASNAVATAGAQFMQSLGLDASRGSREEVYPLSGGSLAKLVRGFAATSEGVDAAYALARTNAPAVAVARAKMRAADFAVDRAIADLAPSVSAEIGIRWADPLWAWNWGLSAVQSVFEGFSKVTAVDRAVVSLQSAAAAVDEAEQTLSYRLETAVAERDNAVKSLEAARATVAFARDNLELVKARYHEGEASRVDYTTALSEYATALGGRVKAFYAGQLAESRLFGLTGRLPEYMEEEIDER